MLERPDLVAAQMRELLASGSSPRRG